MPFQRAIRRTVRGAVLSVVCLASLAACGQRDEQRVLFDGVFFRTKAKAVDRSDRQNFVVNVPKVARSVNGAREAGRYEAVRYCLENFGTSEILWSIGPDTTDGRLVVDKNDFNFRGTCVLW
ncbi:MAG: hypothetical protein AAF686_03880 [Pseudomonadota bacterium]